jgi:hypothetical protein
MGKSESRARGDYLRWASDFFGPSGEEWRGEGSKGRLNREDGRGGE